jgi:hypothetical protein
VFKDVLEWEPCSPSFTERTCLGINDTI